MVMPSWAPATVAAGTGLRGAAEADVVRAAAPNAASKAAAIIDVRKGLLLSCSHLGWWHLPKPRKEQILSRPTGKRDSDRWFRGRDYKRGYF